MMSWLVGKLLPPKPERLGALEPQEVERSIAYMQRKQNDATPLPFIMRKREFSAQSWVTAGQRLPAVYGRLKSGVRGF